MNLLNYLFGEKEDNINNIKTKIDSNQLKEDTNTNIQNEIAMGCCCETCERVTPPCSNSVPFNCTIIVPSIFNLPSGDLKNNISIAWNDNCLHCVMDNCELSATVIDPCSTSSPPEMLPGCMVCVKRFRYIGCIKFIACLSPITGEGNSTACASGTCCACVNQVICFTCNCAKTCPTTGNLVIGYTINGVTQTSVCEGENNVICVSGTFNFTTPPPCATTSTPAVGCGCAQTAASQK